MRTLSYVVDAAVFAVLLFGLETDWITAFIVSEVVGWLIRGVFCREKHAFTSPGLPDPVEPSKERV